MLRFGVGNILRLLEGKELHRLDAAVLALVRVDVIVHNVEALDLSNRSGGHDAFIMDDVCVLVWF